MTDKTISQILAEMGVAGARLDHLAACEAGAGNISICTSQKFDLAQEFPETKIDVELPWQVPALAGYTVFVTGSGCRLRDVAADPKALVSAFVVDEGGKTATWHTHPSRKFERPTSEFNSHLAVHDDQVRNRKLNYQAVIHAQPPYLVSLSHIAQLRESTAFNHAIMRWEPETLVQVPRGIAVLDFMVPGSQELMENNVKALRDHQIVLWSKHGVMVRADDEAMSAVDKIEYLEAGAMYEYHNKTIGDAGEGLSDDEIKAVIEAFGIKTDLY